MSQLNFRFDSCPSLLQSQLKGRGHPVKTKRKTCLMKSTKVPFSPGLGLVRLGYPYPGKTQICLINHGIMSHDTNQSPLSLRLGEVRSPLVAWFQISE